MESSRKAVGRSRLAQRPGLEGLEERLQMSTATPFPTSGPLNGWLFKQVTTKGQPAPGADTGTFSGSSIQPGKISDRAQVVFAETVNNTDGSSAGEGLFRTRFGPQTTAKFLAQPLPKISQIVRQGQAVPGGTLGTTIGPSLVNNGGQIAFAATLKPPADPNATNAGGVYVYLPGRKVLSGVALPQDQMPDGSKFLTPNGRIGFSNKGQLAFTALTSFSTAVGITQVKDAKGNYVPVASTQGTGVYVANSLKQISKLAAPGDLLPDGVHRLDYVGDPTITDAQTAAYVGHVAGTTAYFDPSDATNTRLLGGDLYYVRPGNQPASIVQEGQSLNAAQGGGTLLYALDPVANNKGQVVFHGEVGDPANPAAATTSIFLYSPTTGGVTRIIGAGATLPDGSTFEDAAAGTGSLGFNDRGDIAFLATTSTFDPAANAKVFSQGIYLAHSGSILLVAKVGDVIPALGLGSITGFTQTSKTSGPVINQDSQILFAANTSLGGESLFSATSYRTVTTRSKK